MKPKRANLWRIFWHQKDGEHTRVRWHTGSEAEIVVLQKACIAAGEWHKILEPGTFNPRT